MTTTELWTALVTFNFLAQTEKEATDIIVNLLPETPHLVSSVLLTRLPAGVAAAA